MDWNVAGLRQSGQRQSFAQYRRQRERRRSGRDFCFGLTRASAHAGWRLKRKVRRAATFLVGAAEAPDGNTSCELLAYLNRMLSRNLMPGIATCRCSTRSISRLS